MTTLTAPGAPTPGAAAAATKPLERPRRRRAMLLNVLIVIAALVVVFLIVVALQPAEDRVVRSATIAAPPAAAFGQVNDFRRWGAWSPWAKMDPAMKETFEGAPAGPGAVYTWSGNGQVGEGRMTITESRPN